ncbi:protein phosphatase 1 regulatory subunit 12A-like isoform X9 [Wyeomyia smithii]|uniref:protein phosphatase 1 regulatory subunit 12A-like isoform X9 n=1 Tax=Wyeomyia smithii TaxID=174621 RepID=UPI002467D55D|nr:protein phosphatase 1 regulatory subunit 12A-like isoform X9 [Wyeomyia smithii]
MSMDNRNTSALFKRAEQLKRWEESETNKQSGTPKSPSMRRIKFSSGCIFLAACVAGDKDEVSRLLETGADIDTANVDGLTALHQACIDDNLDMVEFLVQNGADVNRKDNEGWTPLHATSSCGFLSIARYLIENGADLAAINSDGELALDLACSDAMEDLIQRHIDEQGIDCDEARQIEEKIMLIDAKRWLRSDSTDCDKPHPKTGATAVHVAAAKGYIKVLGLLLDGRGDFDKQDVDGWTPLHAAAYWGQKEAVQMLLNANVDIDIQNYSGQYAIDIAQKDIVPLLDEARKNIKRPKRRPASHIRITDTIENSIETPTKVIRVEVKPIDSKEKEEVPEKENQPTEPDVILRRTQSFESDEKKATSNLVLGSTGSTTSSPAATGNVQTSTTPSTTSPPTSPTGTPTTTPSAGQIRRSFVPPTRDEESETQRKAHAKRVRETRRSTQGVTLDEIKSAEQLVKKKNSSNSDNDPATSTTPFATTVTTASTTTTSMSSSTSAPINDRVPSVDPSGTNSEVSSKVPSLATPSTTSEGQVSASFTISAPPSSAFKAQRGDIGGGGGGGDGGGGGSHQPVTPDEDGSKISVSYTISTPRLSSSTTSEISSNTKEKDKADTPTVTAVFSVPSSVNPATTTNNNNNPNSSNNNLIKKTESDELTKTKATIGDYSTNVSTPTTSTSTAATIRAPASFSTSKRSLFDIDNANSLTLAEKLRQEANKYAESDKENFVGFKGPTSLPSTTAPAAITAKSDFTSTVETPASSVEGTISARKDTASAPSSPLHQHHQQSTAERRPSWRLKVDGGSKFKLEDASAPVSSTPVAASTNTVTTTTSSTATALDSSNSRQQPEFNSISMSSLAQRRQNGDSSNLSTTRPISAPELGSTTTAISSNQQQQPANDANLHLRRPLKASEENKENDKENENRGNAQATQAVIQRRRRPKRRSTGVVHVDMEDIDPDRQDSPVDGEEKESGTERGRSRVGSTASELADQKDAESKENGGDYIDYKALYEQAKADNDKLKGSLRKKEEEVISLKAALDRFTTATTKNNSLSELEKRERRAMERKMSEMEEELKLLQKYKTENERLRAENRALTRVVSKLTTSAQNQLHSKQ